MAPTAAYGQEGDRIKEMFAEILFMTQQFRMTGLQRFENKESDAKYKIM